MPGTRPGMTPYLSNCLLVHRPRAEDALPDRAAQHFPAEIEIADKQGEQHERRQAREVEAVLCGLIGERADRITTDKKHREKIKKTRQAAAPECRPGNGCCVRL